VGILSRLPGWLFEPRAGIIAALAGLAVLTGSLAPFLNEDQVLDVALLYLLATLVAAAIWGYWVGLVTAIVADLLVNFFFVAPVHTFTVQEPSNVVALGLFLAVAVVGASMLALLRRQVLVAEARQVEAGLLLSLTQELAHAVSPRDSLQRLCTTATQAVKARGCAVVWFRPPWTVVAATGDLNTLPREEEALASECLRSGQIARQGGAVRTRARRATRTRPEPLLTFVPFSQKAGEQGVLRLIGEVRVPPFIATERLLRAFADEAGLALQRMHLAEEARRVEALQKADEFKSVLLSSVSHDLRSPLTAIKAAASSLRDESVQWSDEDRRSFLETIESQTDRLTGTVTNLLEMSRLEGGVVPTRMESIEVAPLFEEVVQTMRQTAADHPLESEPGSGLWVRADYGLLVQSLENLVENAVKYSRPGGKITLAAEQVGSTVHLCVADEGPGIPPRDLPHIFEKFYRGSQAGKTKGTGLGLSIVKAMIELCGGNIRVQSDESGTVFSIELARGAALRR
jgi:two-component system sensor histidine kinase KdpD